MKRWLLVMCVMCACSRERVVPAAHDLPPSSLCSLACPAGTVRCYHADGGAWCVVR